MAVIEKTVEFDATADEVFSIVEDVEHFSNYSVFINSIKSTGENTYDWDANFFGFHVKWSAKITKRERPHLFEWESTSGAYNKGSYDITELDGKAKVVFTMEYDTAGDILSALTSPVMKKAMEIVSSELMENIEEEIRLRRS